MLSWENDRVESFFSSLRISAGDGNAEYAGDAEPSTFSGLPVSVDEVTNESDKESEDDDEDAAVDDEL